MVSYQEVEDEFLIENPGQLRALVPKIFEGKTTLIQAICEYKGVVDQVTSPTFALLQEYHSPTDIYYHFDFFRIDHASEALDIGTEEYLDSGKICFIEWPSKVMSILPEMYLSIKIEVKGDESRLIKVHRND
jgi:tRNA threonylcarbamoyladenosine biosynthesis protein TsaE